ncbi:MAG: FAD-dependent oxidoreductase [Oscillospiraceae bacterium]|jgi:protoporphyrinogen oxidase|nr:FAD-dependent oxidoreductase [Oscillospiraceae bacterium]
MKQILVIGGGITGLTAADKLLERGCAVTVLEAAASPGGMLAPSGVTAGRRLEAIYHHLFTSDRAAIALLEDLGLRGDLRWHEPSNDLFLGGKRYPFTSPLDLLRFRPLPFAGRVRTGVSVLAAGQIRAYLPLEEQTAKDWLIRSGGKTAYERLWKPLLRSKFGEDADEVSAVWIWNKYKLRGGSREAGGEKLGYLEGGFCRLTDALAQRIRDRGGEIRCGCGAESIRRTADGVRVAASADGEPAEFRADAVLAALPAPALAPLLENAADEEAAALAGRCRAQKYKANLCLALRTEKRLTDAYWTTVCEDDAPFVLLIAQNRLFDDAPAPPAYGGEILYLSRYLDAGDPLFRAPDGEVFARFAEGLTAMFPGFSAADAAAWELFRSPWAQPVIGRRYSRTRIPIRTALPGVYLAGMSQIYPEDRGVNYAVRLGWDAAAEILGERTA